MAAAVSATKLSLIMCGALPNRTISKMTSSMQHLGVILPNVHDQSVKISLPYSSITLFLRSISHKITCGSPEFLPSDKINSWYQLYSNHQETSQILAIEKIVESAMRTFEDSNPQKRLWTHYTTTHSYSIYASEKGSIEYWFTNLPRSYPVDPAAKRSSYPVCR